MRVRKLISTPKTQLTDTGWSTSDMAPRYSGIFPKTLPIRGGWKWRSATCEDAARRKFFLVSQCNPMRDNWKAFLVVEGVGPNSVVARFEAHGNHPGVHSHAHCERSGIELGPSGLDNLVRVPKIGSRHRRVNAWTENSFWEASREFFKISDSRTTPAVLSLFK